MIRPILFLFYLPLCCLAQAPGYMGKKYNIGYGVNISPAFYNATPNNIHVNFIQEVYLDYAAKDRLSIGIAERFYHTIYDNAATLSDLQTSPEGYYDIQGTTLCLNIKYFKGKYVSPWGRYFLISPLINMVKTSYDPYMHVKMRVNNHDTLLFDFGPKNQTFYHFDLLLGAGRTRVLSDRFIIDYGFNFQLFSALKTLNHTQNEFSEPLTQTNYIEETHVVRVQGLNLFNVFLKLGYLF